MEITAIKRQKNHFYSVEFLSGEPILLDKKTTEEAGLFIGQNLNANQIKELQDSSNYTRAFSRAVWYLEQGDLSEKTLRQKLIRAKFAEATAEKVICRLKEISLINDEAYARRLAEKLLNANISERAAVSKMVAKGLNFALAREVVAEIGSDSTAQIKAVIEKKYAKKLLNPENTPKVFAALQRLGFNYSDIRLALKEYSEELEYSEEDYGL